MDGVNREVLRRAVAWGEADTGDDPEAAKGLLKAI